MNIFKAKAMKVGNEMRKDILRMRPDANEIDKELLDSVVQQCVSYVERSERCKAMNRKRKAEKHAQTVDMFSDI